MSESDEIQEDVEREALKKSILRGLGLMGAKGIATGYLQGLEERIEALESKVDDLEQAPLHRVRRKAR